jgi:signal transduction histidine kinase
MCARPDDTVKHRFRLALLAGLAVGSMPAYPALAGQASTPWRVVVLMGSDPGLPAMQQHDRALRATLQAAAPAGVTFFTDTLDSYRFDYGGVAAEFLALQRKKYAGQPVDLLVGVGEHSIEALRDLRDAMWPGVPVVLGALDDATFDRTRVPADAAFVRFRPDVDGTLALVARLQPDARRLIVVGGDNRSDRAFTDHVAARARAQPRWRTEVWDTFSIEQLRERLAGLDASSAVMFTTMTRDANGRTTFPVDAMAQLAAASGAPTYGMYGPYLGRGAAAGSVVDFEQAGRQAALLAIGLLAGRPIPAPDALPIAPVRCVADHARLRAYGLDAGALPAGCDLLNPPRTLWNEYRGAVLVAAAVVALQALTIGGLLVQRRRRRLAEVDALQRRTELARAMRFAAMGELTASIAHEINQPLGAILSNADAADLLLRSGAATPQGLREILADIRRDDLRAYEVIRRLRALLEKHEVEHVGMALHPALDEALAILAPESARRGITIERAFDAADDRLLGDPVQMQQVVLNLALNAMDAMPAGTPGARTVTVRTAGDAEALVLAVEDRGTGIEPSVREAVFDSFFTTKPTGLGLGLPIVRAIVEAHCGRIDAAPREGGGTRFTVRLPRRGEARTALRTGGAHATGTPATQP